jgi:hypothetical protein
MIKKHNDTVVGVRVQDIRCEYIAAEENIGEAVAGTRSGAGA